MIAQRLSVGGFESAVIRSFANSRGLPSNGSAITDRTASGITDITDIASMSGASRKTIKNPLLSVAGSGFAFENYAENPLLVPVTPATPAVLRDGKFHEKPTTRVWGIRQPTNFLRIVRTR